MPNLNLTKILKENLKGAKKVAVLGVGSELKADDRAGMLVVEALQKTCKLIGACQKFKLFQGATAPENLTGEIKKFEPTHLIIVDSADVSEKPGTIEVISPEQVGGISFSTHMMPLKILVDYISQSFTCKTMIIGIQPKSLAYSPLLSAPVKRSVAQVAKSISDAVKATFHSIK